MDPRRQSRAISPVIATMLLVGLTVLLSALVYLMVAGLPASMPLDTMKDLQYIEITAVYDQDDEYAHAMNYDSRVLLTHKGTRELENDDLRALVYRNGEQLNCRIDTLNGVKIQSTVHTGLSRLYGPGSQGKTWAPGETLTIDLNNGTLHPGDELRIDIFSKSKNTVISSDTYQVF
ncbi:MAG: type IV pilin N-terminal domain-containing protein [Methanomicrobiales archaeon]